VTHSNPLRQPEADDEAYQKSYATALRLLARREHSRLELRRKLEARDFGADVIDSVLAEVTDQGFLSDERFADVYVRGRCDRGFGPLRIQSELRERGVSGALADELLAAWADSWLESAARQRAKRFGEQLPATTGERAKQIRFLQQRGFSGDQIRALFRD